MIFLRSVSLRPDTALPDQFPYNLPLVRSLDAISFAQPITFFVGENGSGKSTVLEAIACAARLPTIGAASAHEDPTLADVCALSDALKWVWNQKAKRGFFMRSEDFFGYVKYLTQLNQELRDEMRTLDHEMRGASEYARKLAMGTPSGQLHALKAQYGDGLDAQSHGESYFKLFNARFKPNGLYLLDEPEAPLSPMRQLSFISLLKMMIDQGAQFVIATHSPILLAYPGAAIYSFDGGTVAQADYEMLEHVSVTRTFLENPAAYLKHLMDV